MRDLFSALDLLKAMSRPVLFSKIVHSPGFSRMRELLKCNDAHKAFSDILQTSVKEENRARSFMQPRPKHPAGPHSGPHFLCNPHAQIFISPSYHHLNVGHFHVLLTYSPPNLLNNH